ncbi:MAG TPA: tetratricopeptide repeat protein [Ktedonobacterales bacterium]|nr:tetratricopeptide repeat protein [Ktedonobacterales bacterium]
MRTQIDRWLAEGQTLLDHHDDALALIPLERVLRQASTGSISSQAWRLKSEALEHLGHIEQALDAANHAVQDAPDAIRALAQRAHLYDVLQRYPEAITDSECALEIAPNDLRLWIMLAAFHAHAGNDTAALYAYEQALGLDADDAEAWHGKAIALEHLGRRHDALAAFDRTLQITPPDAPAYAEILTNAAITLSKEGRLRDALAKLEGVYQAIRAPAHDRAYAWELGGDFFADMHQYTEALAHYDQALILVPENARIWDAKGVVLYQLDQAEAAVAAYDEALRIDPSRSETATNRGYALARLLLTEQPPRAPDATAFAEVGDREIWLFEARRFGRLHKWAIAEAAVNQMLCLDPEDGLALILKAGFELLQKRVRMAATTFHQGWRASMRKNQRQREAKARLPEDKP